MPIFDVPDVHHKLVEKELGSKTQRTQEVLDFVSNRFDLFLNVPDWDAEAEAITDPAIEYPAYYRQPFHSMPGGYLCNLPAMADTAAMTSIYGDLDGGCDAVRSFVASYVPEDAGSVAVLGCGTGGDAAAVARTHPGARVQAIDLSPYMLVAARAQYADIPNVEYAHGMAERTGWDDAGFDAVAITLVFHECPDAAKEEILREAHRILRPGGTLVLADTPHDELDLFRGFYEPYIGQWRTVDIAALMKSAGFDVVDEGELADRLWAKVGVAA